MELALLIFAIVMASLAVATVIVSVIMELVEGRDIHQQGWVHGHHRSHWLNHPA